MEVFNFENKKKVVFISHSSNIEGGGAERSFFELLKEITTNPDSNIIPYVIFPDENGTLIDKVKKLGIKCVCIPFRWWVFFGEEKKEDIIKQIAEQSFVFCDEIKKINPDLIYTITSVVSFGAMISKELNIPHIWSIREYGEADHNLKFVLEKSDRFKYIDSNSDFVIFNCKGTRDYYLDYSDFKNSKFIYTNITVKDFEKNDKNKYFSSKKNVLKIAVVGRIVESKGQKDVVLAVRDLIRDGFDVELCLAGYVDQTYLSEFKEILEEFKDKIKLVGQIDDAEVLLSESDLVVVSSKKEAFGRVAVESMLLKKPVIGANSGGTIEQIQNGFNGFLYEPKNHLNLKDKILYFINNREKLVEMGQNGYNFAKSNFSKEKYSGEIIKIINSLLENRKKVSLDIFEEKRIKIARELIDEKNKAISISRDQFQKQNEELNFVKSSKFWKLREIYVKYKNKIVWAIFCPKKFVKKYFGF